MMSCTVTVLPNYYCVNSWVILSACNNQLQTIIIDCTIQCRHGILLL